MLRHRGIFFLSQGSLSLINPIMWTARCWCRTIFFVTFTFYNNQAICITYLNTELSCFQTFAKYSSQWTFYSAFWFLSISKPRNITPTGEPNFMKNTAARSPKAAATTCPTLGTGVWEMLRLWEVTLHSRDPTFPPPPDQSYKIESFQSYKTEDFQNTKLRRSKVYSRNTSRQ